MKCLLMSNKIKDLAVHEKGIFYGNFLSLRIHTIKVIFFRRFFLGILVHLLVRHQFSTNLANNKPVRVNSIYIITHN